MRKYFLIGFLLLMLGASNIVSCSGTPSVGKKQVPASKMTTREKVAKNHILEKESNWRQKNFAGKVKVITSTTYSISDKGEKSFDSKKSESFDAGGNRVGSARYDQSGKVTEQHEWTYDANGNDTLYVIYAADNVVSCRKALKYDAHGNQVAQYEYAPDGMLTGTYTYKYDDKGNQVESTYANEYGKGRYTYTYDANGFTTGRIYYDTSGKVNDKFVYTVDEYGNQLESTMYNADGSVYSKYVTKYDDYGNSTETVLYKSGERARVVAKYDDNGNKISTDVYATDGKLSERASSTQELVYDKTGNVIKDTKFKIKNGKRNAVEVREVEIVYY